MSMYDYFCQTYGCVWLITLQYLSVEINVIGLDIHYSKIVKICRLHSCVTVCVYHIIGIDLLSAPMPVQPRATPIAFPLASSSWNRTARRPIPSGNRQETRALCVYIN